MATYYNIKKEEMESFLLSHGFKPVAIPGTVELVYGKLVGKDLCLRVFTGINPTGESREVGKDAIRICLVSRNMAGEIKGVGSSRRVHRVEGWRNNLQARLDSWADLLPPACPVCGSHMAERNGKNGKFWGCSNYPNCKGTASITSE